MATKLVAAYGVGYIKPELLQSFMKSKWELLDYTSNNITFEEVISKNPIVTIGFSPPEQIRQCPSVNYIITPGAGIDHLPIEEIKKQGQTVINCHANSSSVAEHAWALLLAIARKLVKYHNLVSEMEKWPPRAQVLDTNTDITGKTIAIVGYGHIGQKLEQIANAFSMEVLIFRKSPEQGQFHFNELAMKARDFDILMLACPLTNETRGIVDTNILELLPSHTIIVNIARGELIDEKALIDALIEGKIRAAGIDVWHNSPYGYSSEGLSPDKFIGTPGLLISPHRAWVSRESHASIAKQLALELDLIAQGKVSSNIVDFNRGY